MNNVDKKEIFIDVTNVVKTANIANNDLLITKANDIKAISALCNNVKVFTVRLLDANRVDDVSYWAGNYKNLGVTYDDMKTLCNKFVQLNDFRRSTGIPFDFGETSLRSSSLMDRVSLNKLIGR